MRVMKMKTMMVSLASYLLAAPRHFCARQGQAALRPVQEAGHQPPRPAAHLQVPQGARGRLGEVLGHFQGQLQLGFLHRVGPGGGFAEKIRLGAAGWGERKLRRDQAARTPTSSSRGRLTCLAHAAVTVCAASSGIKIQPLPVSLDFLWHS